MSIVLFAIIGATIKAGTGYWVCYSIYCMLWFFEFMIKIFKDQG